MGAPIRTRDGRVDTGRGTVVRPTVAVRARPVPRATGGRACVMARSPQRDPSLPTEGGPCFDSTRARSGRRAARARPAWGPSPCGQSAPRVGRAPTSTAASGVRGPAPRIPRCRPRDPSPRSPSPEPRRRRRRRPAASRHRRHARAVAAGLRLTARGPSSAPGRRRRRPRRPSGRRRIPPCSAHCVGWSPARERADLLLANRFQIISHTIVQTAANPYLDREPARGRQLAVPVPRDALRPRPRSTCLGRDRDRRATGTTRGLPPPRTGGRSNPRVMPPQSAVAWDQMRHRPAGRGARLRRRATCRPRRLAAPARSTPTARRSRRPASTRRRATRP